MFHRLTVPSYFGGLPVGYDYVNNALAGTPSFAAGVKVGGPNSGTYFVAFGEDATSSDANRPARALAENTDILDDLLHRDIALPVRTVDVGPTGAPTSSVVITGPVFLGLIGAQLKDVFHVMNATDEDFDVGGVPVFVASITGGVVGTGFSAGNVTVTFNIPIPTGSTYHLYYGQRSNLATFPADGLTNVRIRNAQQVDFQLEEVLRALHGNGEPWDAPWDATIFGLNTSVNSLNASRTTDEAHIATNTANITTNTAAIAAQGVTLATVTPLIPLVSDLIARRGEYRIMDAVPCVAGSFTWTTLSPTTVAGSNLFVVTTGIFTVATKLFMTLTMDVALSSANTGASPAMTYGSLQLAWRPTGAGALTYFGQLYVPKHFQTTQGGIVHCTFSFELDMPAGQDWDIYVGGGVGGANAGAVSMTVQGANGFLQVLALEPAIP